MLAQVSCFHLHLLPARLPASPPAACCLFLVVVVAVVVVAGQVLVAINLQLIISFRLIEACGHIEKLC